MYFQHSFLKGIASRAFHWSVVLIKSRAICCPQDVPCNSKAISKLKLMTKQRFFFPSVNV